MITKEKAIQNNRTYRKSIEDGFEERKKDTIDYISREIDSASRKGNFFVNIELPKDEISSVEVELLEQILIKSGFFVEHLSGYIFSFAFCVKW